MKNCSAIQIDSVHRDDRLWLEKVINGLKGSKIVPTPRRVSNEEINVASLEKCLKTIAKVVAEYGKDYLPIFERVYAELEKKRQQQTILDMALNLANENNPSVKVSQEL
ncbi:MAG: hypothetical protein RIF33_11645 [Cyclobacteriaceae bacterium]